LSGNDTTLNAPGNAADACAACAARMLPGVPGHIYIRPATPRLNGKVCEDLSATLHRSGPPIRRRVSSVVVPV
jgi:hypothetical protein